MSRRIASVAVSLLVFGLIWNLLPGAAQTPVIVEEGPILDLYLTEKGLDPTPPTAAASQQRSIVSDAATPAASFFVEWGSYKMPHDLTFTSDGVSSFWLTAKNTAVIHQVRTEIRKGTTVVTTGSSGNYVDTAGNGAGNTVTKEKPLPFTLGLGLKGTAWKEGDLFNVRFIVFGVTAEGTDTEVFVNYGSTVHPSRISASVSNIGALPSTSAAEMIYLADPGLSFDAPTSATDKTRASGNTGASSLGSAPAWTWGEIRTDRELKLTTDSAVTAWVTLQGNAAALRGFRTTVTLDKTTVTNQVGVATNTYQSATGAPAVSKFVLGLPTKGLTLPADSKIKIEFSVWSSSDASTGQIVFLYGSTAHPAGLRLGVEGAGGVDLPTGPVVPAVRANVTVPPAPVKPGGEARIDVTVANTGATETTVRLEAEGLSLGYEAAFEPAEEFKVAAGATQAASVAVSVPEKAKPGPQSFTLRVESDNETIHESTVSFSVAEAAKPAASATVAADADAEAGAQGAPAEPFDLSGPEAAVPGPGLGAVVLALVGLVVLWRRRR